MRNSRKIHATQNSCKNHVWGIRVSGHCFSANRVSGGTPVYFPFIEVSTLIIYKLYVKPYCFKYVPLFNLDVKLILYLGLFKMRNIPLFLHSFAKTSIIELFDKLNAAKY